MHASAEGHLWDPEVTAQKCSRGKVSLPLAQVVSSPGLWEGLGTQLQCP